MKTPIDNSAQRLTRPLRVSTPDGIVLYVFQPPTGWIRVSTTVGMCAAPTLSSQPGSVQPIGIHEAQLLYAQSITRPLTESKAHQSNTHAFPTSAGSHSAGENALQRSEMQFGAHLDFLLESTRHQLRRTSRRSFEGRHQIALRDTTPKNHRAGWFPPSGPQRTCWSKM